MNNYFYFTRTKGLFRICFPKEKSPAGKYRSRVRDYRRTDGVTYKTASPLVRGGEWPRILVTSEIRYGPRNGFFAFLFYSSLRIKYGLVRKIPATFGERRGAQSSSLVPRTSAIRENETNNSLIRKPLESYRNRYTRTGYVDRGTGYGTNIKGAYSRRNTNVFPPRLFWPCSRKQRV